jgi:hypothetical protein
MGRRMRSAAVWFVAAWGIGGCGTETGNPDGSMVELGYNARSSNPDDVGFEPTSRLQVDAVWLRLGDAHLDVSCPGEALRFDGIGLADHAGKTAAWQDLVPAEGEASSSYCGVGTWARIVDDDSDDPVDVAGAAIAVTGWLRDGRPFTVRIRRDVDLAVQIAPEVDPSEAPWLMTFDVAAWLAPEELEALPDPVVEVDDGSEVGDRIVERLAEGLQLHQDFDHDGAIDRDDLRIDR